MSGWHVQDMLTVAGAAQFVQQGALRMRFAGSVSRLTFAGRRRLCCDAATMVRVFRPESTSVA